MTDFAVSLAVIGGVGWSLTTAIVSGLPFDLLLPSLWAVPIFVGLGIVAMFVLDPNFRMLPILAWLYAFVVTLLIFILDFNSTSPAVTASEWAYAIGLTALLIIGIFAECAVPKERPESAMPIYTGVTLTLAFIALVYNMFVASELHGFIDGSCWTCVQFTEIIYHQALTLIVTFMFVAIYARETEWARVLMKVLGGIYVLFLVAFAITKASIGASAGAVWATVVTAIIGIVVEVWGAVMIKNADGYVNATNIEMEGVTSRRRGLVIS